MLTRCCFSTSPTAISFASSVHESLPTRRRRILLLPRPFSSANNLLFSHHPSDNNGERWAISRVAASRRARTPGEGEEEDEGEEEEKVYSERAKGSGTTARGRRLLKVREEKRKREYDRLHNYPTWAKILENACKDDEELRAVLGDSIGNPELMRKRIFVLCSFNLLDSYIWFELYGAPSDRDVDLLGSVIQSWYVLGRLGAFNSSNLQLANSSMDYNPLYDSDKAARVMPSSFHDISDVEFQDNWGRVWVDLGTSEFFAVDVLLNCLTVLSSEYLGIQQVVFGGRRMGDWEEGMTSSEYGYKHFKI
ncbi:hypothetical protein COCNU_09G006990 [Cocos nucifera]|uniref:Uncharacterized protein n=1 Tax=Cocos nucifera TaxID=13894 RepID=A0A8K0IKP9_COCNU|nr:hypothetical protein COCNU_09G006990 [Cocos nucifera]